LAPWSPKALKVESNSAAMSILSFFLLIIMQILSGCERAGTLLLLACSSNHLQTKSAFFELSYCETKYQVESNSTDMLFLSYRFYILLIMQILNGHGRAASFLLLVFSWNHQEAKVCIVFKCFFFRNIVKNNRYYHFQFSIDDNALAQSV
jgi:hypothetical protein